MKISTLYLFMQTEQLTCVTIKLGSGKHLIFAFTDAIGSFLLRSNINPSVTLCIWNSLQIYTREAFSENGASSLKWIWLEITRNSYPQCRSLGSFMLLQDSHFTNTRVYIAFWYTVKVPLTKWTIFFIYQQVTFKIEWSMKHLTKPISLDFQRRLQMRI